MLAELPDERERTFQLRFIGEDGTAGASHSDSAGSRRLTGESFSGRGGERTIRRLVVPRSHGSLGLQPRERPHPTAVISRARLRPRAPMP
jgi:hypothetical protein